MTLENKKLQDLFKSFYQITNIKVAIKDNNSNEVFTVPNYDCSFCRKLRENSSIIKKCRECELKNLNSFDKDNGLIIYKCHMGLTEAIFPLKIDGINIGYIMLGQVLCETVLPDYNKKLLADALTFSDKITVKDVNAITVKKSYEIEASAKILEALANHILSKNLIKADFGGIALKIANYIDEHISEELSVDFLCDYFNLSRNMLYKISNKYFNMPIAKFIRKKRVTRAAELIKGGISIGNAANIVGISDYSYFTKIAKKELGILPSKIKAQY